MDDSQDGMSHMSNETSSRVNSINQNSKNIKHMRGWYSYKKQKEEQKQEKSDNKQLRMENDRQYREENTMIIYSKIQSIKQTRERIWVANACRFLFDFFLG